MWVWGHLGKRVLLEAADVQASSPDALGMGWQQGSSAGFRDTAKLVLSAVLKKKPALLQTPSDHSEKNRQRVFLSVEVG